MAETRCVDASVVGSYFESMSEFLQLPNGIPSRDCIRRTLIAIKPLAFQQCFEAWTRDLMKADDTNGKILVAIVEQIHQGNGA